MKTQDEIKEMIDRLERLRKVIPQKSTFGHDNWKETDIEIATLKTCLGQSESEIEKRCSTRVDIIGDEWCEDPEVRSYDWIADKTDSICDEESVKMFADKKAKSNEE